MKLKLNNLERFQGRELRKKYIDMYHKISEIQDYSKLRNLVFSSLGICTFSFQLIETTLLGIYNTIKLINDEKDNLDETIENNYAEIIKNIFSEDFEVVTSQDSLTGKIELFKEMQFLNQHLHDRLYWLRDKRNFIIHFSVIKNPFLLSQQHNMYEFCNDMSYNTFLVAEVIEDIKKRFDELYTQDYPRLVKLINETIETFNKVSNQIIKI
jgi:hypothetical protein